MRFRALALMASLAALLLASCARGGTSAPAQGAPAQPGSSAPAPPPARITVGYGNVIPQNLPMWLAQEAGYYTRNGLDVDLTTSQAATGMAALLSGELHMLATGAPEVLHASASGGEAIVLANWIPVTTLKFMVHSSIRTKEDLIGKRVGVTRFGSSTDTATRGGLRRIGLDPERDVTIVQLENSQGVTAGLLAGAVQGAARVPPDTIRLEAQGFYPLFDLAALGMPAADVILTATRPWVNANRDVVQRYVDSLVQAIALAKRDRALAIDVLRRNLKVDDDAALEATYDYFVQTAMVSLPYPKPEQLAEAAATLERHNEALKGFDLNQVLDPSFVASAEQRGLAGS